MRDFVSSENGQFNNFQSRYGRKKVQKENVEFLQNISPENLNFCYLDSFDGSVKIEDRLWTRNLEEDDMRIIVSDVLTSIRKDIRDTGRIKNKGIAFSSEVSPDDQRAQYNWEIKYILENENITGRTLFIDDVGDAK